MQIRFGYEIVYQCPQPTPMILNLHAHYSRASDLLVPDHLRIDPPVSVTMYRDGFGNWCNRVVLPVYGGQGYGVQLSALRRGVHVVVGTPGRIMDHLAKGTLDLSELKYLVLDEADEMLKMGFAEDVETILAETPKGKQVALFSATMPKEIMPFGKQ